MATVLLEKIAGRSQVDYAEVFAPPLLVHYSRALLDRPASDANCLKGSCAAHQVIGCAVIACEFRPGPHPVSPLSQLPWYIL